MNYLKSIVKKQKEDPKTAMKYSCELIDGYIMAGYLTQV